MKYVFFENVKYLIIFKQLIPDRKLGELKKYFGNLKLPLSSSTWFSLKSSIIEEI